MESLVDVQVRIMMIEPGFTFYISRASSWRSGCIGNRLKDILVWVIGKVADEDWGMAVGREGWKIST